MHRRRSAPKKIALIPARVLQIESYGLPSALKFFALLRLNLCKLRLDVAFQLECDKDASVIDSLALRSSHPTHLFRAG